MRTEKEIKEYIERWYNHAVYSANVRGLIEGLKWVLQTTPPKRTVFDLTKEELEELLNIVNPDGNNKIVIITKKEDDMLITTETTYFFLYPNLDIIPYKPSHSYIVNLVKYIDRIKEMLNEVTE